MENTKNNTKSVMLIFVIILAVAILVLGYFYYTQKKESEKIISQLEEYGQFISDQKDSLEYELKGIIVQYDSLMTENDTMNLKLAQQQDKIERLLRMRMSDAQKIKKYEKELGTIREVLKTYIVQIDSLNTRNKELMVENKELKNESARVTTMNRQLSEEKEELLTITSEAKTLVASDILGVGLSKRSREINRFAKVEKIRVDFTIRKNSVAEPGEKTIYLRLLRPDGLVLGSAEASVITVNGEDIPYSASREVMYENTDVPMAIYWDNNGDLVGGNYKIEIYEGGKLIGESELALK